MSETNNPALITTANPSSTNTVNLSRLNTPPSLILSPSSADSPSETTPSALNPSWKSKGTDKIFDDSNPVDSSSTPSPHPTLDDPIGLSRENQAHSRGSSTASSISAIQKQDSSHRSFASPLAPETAAIASFSSERPHSFSGGISQSDLRRLQNLTTKGQPPSPISTLERLDGPRTSPPKENANESWGDKYSSSVHMGTPPRFPTLGEQPTAFPSIQGQNDSVLNSFNNMNPSTLGQKNDIANSNGDFQSRSQGNNQGLYNTSRHELLSPRNSRQPMPSGYPVPHHQELLQQPGYIYPTQNRPAPLDRTLQGYAHQGYYDLNSPPAMRRDQQMLSSQRLPASPHAPFIGIPPTVAGDPSLRGAMSLSMLNGAQSLGPFVGLPNPAAGIYNQPPNSASPMTGTFPGFNGQSFYSPSPGYNTPEALSSAMGRMTISPPYDGSTDSRGDAESPSNQPGPSANNRKLGLYKTELCRSWEEKGSCRYGAKCQFAHSDTEVRKVSRHPKYKTEICRTFWVSGSCPYGKRCCFIHTELKNSNSASNNEANSTGGSNGGQNNSDNTSVTGRDRSHSNASGAGSQPGSRLSLLPGQRDNLITLNSPDTFSFAKPTGSLRVDTSSLSAPKVNRAGPLTSNPALMASSNHQSTGLSPILPATAGPDFGRQAAARREVVGYDNLSGNTQKSLNNSKTNRDSQLRHSFNGTEMGLSIPSPTSNSSVLPGPYSPLTPNPGGTQTPTNNNMGHQRSGSAGQWPVGVGTRNTNPQHLVSPSYLAGNENGSPWGGLPELSIDRKRLSGTWL